jgi:hypothetical protein
MRWFAIVAFFVGCERAEPQPPPDPPDPLDTLQLPEVNGSGAIAYERRSPLVIASPVAMFVDGARVLALRGGVVATTDIEGGSDGLKIQKVTTALEAAPGSRDGVLGVALDRRLPYALLIRILFSAKQQEAGWTRFAIVARSHGKLVAFPYASQVLQREDRVEADGVLAKLKTTYLSGITRCYELLLASNQRARGPVALAMPMTASGRVDRATARGVAPALEQCIERLTTAWEFPMPRDDRGEPMAGIQVVLHFEPDRGVSMPSLGMPASLDASARLAISITATDYALWSLVGLEGNRRDPKLVLAHSDPAALGTLGTALAEIAQRRWGGRTRPDSTRSILIVASAETPMQTVAEVFDVARTTFPDLLLSSGFE